MILTNKTMNCIGAEKEVSPREMKPPLYAGVMKRLRKLLMANKPHMNRLMILLMTGAVLFSTGIGICYGQTTTDQQRSVKSTLPEVVVTDKQDSMHAPAVSTATMTPADPVELPLSVEVVPQKLIEERNASSFYETLQYVSGVYTGGNSSFTNSSGRPTIRGFTGNDVMLDGIVLPARMPIFFDAVGVSAIEFSKGPLNSIQGGQGSQQGSGGAVNILGKMPELSGTFQQLSIGGTFFNGSSGRLTYDPNVKINDHLALRMPISYTVDRPYYLPQNLEAGSNVFLAPTVNWQPTTKATAMVAFTLQQSNKAAYQGIPYLKGDFLAPVDTYYGNSDTRDRYTGVTGQGKIDYKFTEALKLSVGGGFARADERRNHWSVSASAQGMTTVAYYDKIIATRTAIFGYTSGNYLDTNLSAFAHLNYDLNMGKIKHQLLVGADWLQRETSGESSMYTASGWQSLTSPTLTLPATPLSVTPMLTKVYRNGLILQDFISWGDWRFLLGTRSDNHKSSTGNTADSFSPRVGITYLIRPEFAVYANYTLAKGPNFGFNDINNQELTNNWESEQYEVGTKKRFFDNLWATVALFQVRQKNVPKAYENNPTRYYTEGENRSNGLEMSLSGEIRPNWSWWGSYTYQDYKSLSDNIEFLRIPQHSLALWTSYRIPSGAFEGLKGGIGYRFASKYCTTFRGIYINDQYMIDPYHVVDVSAEYPIKLKWLSEKKISTKIEAGVKNVFNAEYVESNRHGTENFPGQPRILWARMSYTF